ncbi:MAG: DUF177 domain-containing protein [Bacillota bacterium]|nr:DUF177 domain-containing protein [Bacillota bacterium]
MIVELSRLRRQAGSRRELRFVLDGAQLAKRDAAWRFPEAPLFEGRLEHTGGGRYLLSGRLTGTAETDCARCLAATRLPFDLEVEEIYLPQHSVDELNRTDFGDDAGADGELDQEAERALPHDGQYLDTDPGLEAVLWLALPPVVLCSDDCRGLCPICGCNRNTDSCGCQPEPVGSFSALAELGRLLAKTNDE